MKLPEINLLAAETWKDYELLDSGEGAKLERFGPYQFIRPEHQATWRRKFPIERWNSAHAIFRAAGGEETGGNWQVKRPVKPDWKLTYADLIFWAHFTSSRHLGVFPEQAAHWDWCRGKISRANRPLKVLNLFGYTGLATVAAAAAGASVTHVDAAKKSVNWARENLDASGLGDRPVRWIVDDALKFVQREERRGVNYDGIILDPPKFGRGPKGEVWECFEMLPELLGSCRAILAEKPLFVVITAYAIRSSALSLYYALDEVMHGLGGQCECGELMANENSAGRAISLAIYARWAAL